MEEVDVFGQEDVQGGEVTRKSLEMVTKGRGKWVPENGKRETFWDRIRGSAATLRSTVLGFVCFSSWSLRK